eukprot:364887-Chlamydomonas_euryale.AAC.2
MRLERFKTQSAAPPSTARWVDLESSGRGACCGGTTKLHARRVYAPLLDEPTRTLAAPVHMWDLCAGKRCCAGKRRKALEGSHACC